MRSPGLADECERLRDMATQHATVQGLLEQLPRLPPDGTPSPGLYVDATNAPGFRLNGVTRVSVLRLYSVAPGGRRLLGQIQASRRVGTALEEVQLHHYLHLHSPPVCVEVRPADAWLMRVLDHHYQRDGGEATFRPLDVAP